MAERSKKRSYDADLQDYKPAKGDKRGKKRKQTKDPNAPKRALSAFFWFCNDERSIVKDANPDFRVGDIAKVLGKRWAEKGPDMRSKYEAMAEKDKARYEREMTAYKKKLKGGQTAALKPAARVPVDDDDEEEEEEEEEDDE